MQAWWYKNGHLVSIISIVYGILFSVKMHHQLSREHFIKRVFVVNKCSNQHWLMGFD